MCVCVCVCVCVRVVAEKKINRQLRYNLIGNSLVLQWLGLCTFTAEGAGSIPGQGTKIPQAAVYQKKKKKTPNLINTRLVRPQVAQRRLIKLRQIC